jgi:hypothetical protein
MKLRRSMQEAGKRTDSFWSDAAEGEGDGGTLEEGIFTLAPTTSMQSDAARD